MIPDPSQLIRPWPQKSVESILIIHHYPTFSGGLVLQLGWQEAAGPTSRRPERPSHGSLHHTTGRPTPSTRCRHAFYTNIFCPHLICAGYL